MGLVKSEELSNGNIGLEITYGGKEAPFGGVDTSAPPAYIDPRCFTAVDGMLVVDNRLCAVNVQPLVIPTLWNGVTGITLLKFGTFYNSTNGQLNYAFGYAATPIVGPPSGCQYTYYMTSWNPANIADNTTDVFSVGLYDSFTPPVSASLLVDTLQSQAVAGTGGTGGTCHITSVNGSGGITGITVSGGVNYAIGNFGLVVQAGGSLGYILVTSIGVGGSLLTASVGNLGTGYTVGAATVNFTNLSVAALLISQSNLSCTVTSLVGSGTITVTGGQGFVVGDVLGVWQWNFSFYPQLEQITDVTITSVSSTGVITGFTNAALASSASLGFAYIGDLAPAATGTFPLTYEEVATSIVALINGASYATPLRVTAEVVDSGTQFIVTAPIPGPSGNLITLQDLSYNMNYQTAPPFYFPFLQPVALEGGVAQVTLPVPRSFTPPASTAEVGGTLYIGNIGPMILQYSGPSTLGLNTMYCGVKVLRKFAGALIGLCVNPQIGVFTQNTDMIFVWSSPEDLQTWNPIDQNGNVTGAGFAELDDISDYLTGLVVSNGTAFIIRAQGLSYATPTGNSTLPYDFNHIGLGDEGEGCQIPALVAQYDQTGAFVGNSDIFQVSGTITPIGTKIKQLFFQSLAEANPNILGTSICSVNIGGDEFPLLAFSVGLSPTVVGFVNSLSLFLYNPSNGTWGIVSFQVPALIGTLQLGTLATENAFSSSSEYNQTLSALMIQNQALTTIEACVISEGLPVTASISNEVSIEFPVEEISFGRDITIDALYVAMQGQITADAEIQFYISGNLFATLTITPAQLASVVDNPTEFQVFSASSTTAGAVTAHAPQVSARISSSASSGAQLLRFTKLALFGSFDPKQRPV